MYTFNDGWTESTMLTFPFIPTEYFNRFKIVSASRPRFAMGFFNDLKLIAKAVLNVITFILHGNVFQSPRMVFNFKNEVHLILIKINKNIDMYSLVETPRQTLNKKN